MEVGCLNQLNRFGGSRKIVPASGGSGSGMCKSVKQVQCFTKDHGCFREELEKGVVIVVHGGIETAP